MQLQQASRNKAKIKMALQGPSGSGKTMSAILIAYGLTQAWDTIAIIDTEYSSANLYAHLGNYKVLPLNPPFTPEKYIQAIQLCISSGIKVIILDSLSHEWEGAGGILDMHSNMAGNSFTNWAKLTPRHNALIQEILQIDTHCIATLRTKQDYILVEKNGKNVPEKVGLKSIQRDGTDYEFTLVLDIDIKHNAIASKDRTGLFIDKPQFIPNQNTGIQINEWCNTVIPIQITPLKVSEILEKIDACNTVDALLELYQNTPQHQEQLLPEFTKRRQEILSQTNSHNLNKFTQNGTPNS